MKRRRRRRRRRRRKVVLRHMLSVQKRGKHLRTGNSCQVISMVFGDALLRILFTILTTALVGEPDYTINFEFI